MFRPSRLSELRLTIRYRSDLLQAARSQHVPLFPLQNFRNIQFLSVLSIGCSPDLYELKLSQNLIAVLHVDKYIEFWGILCSLHELSTFLNSTPADELPGDANYPDRVYAVEHSIATAVAEAASNKDCDRSEISFILLHSALLFIYTNLRQTPVGGSIRITLVARLRSVLEITHTIHLTEYFLQRSYGYFSLAPTRV
jgi:hypothetical protein